MSKSNGAWQHPRHRQCDVRSVMDLCLYIPGTAVEWPAIHSVATLIFAAMSPSDELRYFVKVYEGLAAHLGASPLCGLCRQGPAYRTDLVEVNGKLRCPYCRAEWKRRRPIFGRQGHELVG